MKDKPLHDTHKFLRANCHLFPTGTRGEIFYWISSRWYVSISVGWPLKCCFWERNHYGDSVHLSVPL